MLTSLARLPLYHASMLLVPGLPSGRTAKMVSDLKIVLAWPSGFRRTPGFELNFLQFLAHESESLAEFLGFDFYYDSTVMTAYASFGTRLKVANQDRILLATIG